MIPKLDWVPSENEFGAIFASIRTAGGPGSGNFGHAGRPGEVGGSAPSWEGVETRGKEDPRGFPEDEDLRGDELPPRMEKANARAVDEGAEYLENLDWSQREAIQRYQGNEYGRMRAESRRIERMEALEPEENDEDEDDEDEDDEDDDEPVEPISKDVLELQRALVEAPYLPNGMITYRGLSMDKAEASAFMNKLQPGDTMVMKGFQSTTLNFESVGNFLDSAGGVMASSDFERGVLLEIVPTRGVHLGHEDEVLLPAGSRFEVVAIKDVEMKTGRMRDIRRPIVQLRQLDTDE